MSANYYKITKKDLFDLFGRLAGTHKVFVPYARGERLYFDRFDPAREDAIELGGVRQSQPLKSFINPAREKVGNGAEDDSRVSIVAGVKACDMASLVLQDFVFLQGDVEDPFYAAYRKNTILISSDCTYAKETCFCACMEGRPYPAKYFDMNLSAITDHFLVEVVTDKAKALVNDFRTFFKGYNPEDVRLRDINRERVTAQVKDFIARRGTKSTAEIKGVVEKHYDLNELWQDFASTCVECGACNLVCPTCHCFLLFDGENKEKFKSRYRIWDACLYKTFARVAGGANPRRHLYERLRNRFDKKFDFFPKVLGYFACTGCGRCIEACPGDIDLREVLKGLVDGKWNKPPNK